MSWFSSFINTKDVFEGLGSFASNIKSVVTGDLPPELKIKQEEINVESKKLDVENTSNARNREALIMSENTPLINKIIAPVLAGVIVFSSFLIFYLVIFCDLQFDNTKKELLFYILGILSAAFIQILNYYFGSSSGSAEKSRFLQNNLNKN